MKPIYHALIGTALVGVIALGLDNYMNTRFYVGDNKVKVTRATPKIGPLEADSGFTQIKFGDGTKTNIPRELERTEVENVLLQNPENAGLTKSPFTGKYRLPGAQE